MNEANKQLSASLEDYLEAIFLLSQSGKVARSKDIAEHLGVARPSVTGALRSLTRKRLIHYKPYGYITLTEKGLRMAGKISKRHAALESFFVDILGVERDAAERAACMAEHAVGGEITARLTAYLDFVAGQDTAETFKHYYESVNKAQS